MDDASVIKNGQWIPADGKSDEIFDVYNVLSLLWHVLFPEEYPLNEAQDD